MNHADLLHGSICRVDRIKSLCGFCPLVNESGDESTIWEDSDDFKRRFR